MFEKSVGEFEPNPPIYNSVFGYNHGEGLYKPLFYKKLELNTRNIGKKYMEDPDNAQVAEDVLNKAYQIIMVNVVEKTTANEKGVPYDAINKAFDATSNNKQIGLFIKEKITSIKFKQTYEKLVLGAAKEGKLGIDAALEACDKALGITLEEYEKNKDITNENNIKIMAENLHRKIKSVTISQNKTSDKKATGKKTTETGNKDTTQKKTVINKK